MRISLRLFIPLSSLLLRSKLDIRPHKEITSRFEVIQSKEAKHVARMDGTMRINSYSHTKEVILQTQVFELRPIITGRIPTLSFQYQFAATTQFLDPRPNRVEAVVRHGDLVNHSFDPGFCRPGRNDVRRQELQSRNRVFSESGQDLLARKHLGQLQFEHFTSAFNSQSQRKWETYSRLGVKSLAEGQR